MATYIPLLSLIVAGLAVFVGPTLGWLIARQQIRSASKLAMGQIHSSLEVANKQIVAPMRQAWINTLRELLAEVSSTSMHYYLAGQDGRLEAEYQRIGLLEERIKLMLNPREANHIKLESLVRELVGASNPQSLETDHFLQTYTELTKLARVVLKEEWDRVKSPILPQPTATDA